MSAPTITFDAPTPTGRGEVEPEDCGYRPHLDGIRALAVAIVILFHFGFTWMPGGFIGVDVFFVLSGYLITGLLIADASRTGRVRLGRFYARRMRRLLPGSVLVLLAITVAAVHLLDAAQRQVAGQDITAAALWSSNWRFASGEVDYFTPGDVPSPVLHFWSLAVEEQFYLVWPLLFTGLWRLSARGRQSVRHLRTGRMLAILAGLAAASAVLSVVLVPSPMAYFGTHTRAYQLLSGAGLAVGAVHLRRRLATLPGGAVPPSVAAFVSLAVLGWVAVDVPDADRYPGPAALVVTAASALLILATDLAQPGPLVRVLGHRVPAAVGRLSYSLYLWHWPVIVFAPLAARQWGLESLRSRWTQAAVIGLAALASYLLVERPVRFRLWTRAPFPALVATGLAVSLVASLVGVPFLAPGSAFEARALEAVRDVAPSGDCPYDRRFWGPPSTSEPCIHREGGPFVVAIVGDSHALQWQPAIDVLADRDDLTVIRVTRKGCPANALSVYTLDSLGQPHPDRDCDIWRDRVYRRLIERFDPDLVFVATRSHDWGIRADEGDVDREDPGHLEVWTEAWRPTLVVLSAGTGTVVVSRILPVLPWRLPACLAEHGEGTMACDMPVAEDTRVVDYNAGMARVAAEFSDVRVVDLTPIPCPDDVCPAVISDVIVHRDDDHISATFARSVADQLERRLRDAGVAW